MGRRKQSWAADVVMQKPRPKVGRVPRVTFDAAYLPEYVVDWRVHPVVLIRTEDVELHA